MAMQQNRMQMQQVNLFIDYFNLPPPFSVVLFFSLSLSFSLSSVKFPFRLPIFKLLQVLKSVIFGI